MERLWAEPAVARLSDGGYVVVWEDQGAADGGGYGVYGQRYDSNDNAVGGQFRVNTATTSNQYEAQITALTGGGWVVTWRSDNQDGSGTGVYAQRYAADGSAAGGEFRVNTTITADQSEPAVLGLADGSFIVAFSELIVTNAWRKIFSYLVPPEWLGDGLYQALSTDYKVAVSFTILIMVLLFRPQGIFGGK